MNSYPDFEPTADSINYENNAGDHTESSPTHLKQQNNEVNGIRNWEAVDDPSLFIIGVYSCFCIK